MSIDNIKFDFITGWVRLHNPLPVYDKSGMLLGFTQRITDSNGRDEILPPIAKITY